MNRRFVAVVGLILLLVLAGCSGASPGPNGADSTDSSTDGEADATAREGPSGDGESTADGGSDGSNGEPDDPPGVTDGTVTDPEALLSAHERALSETSVTVGIEYELVAPDERTAVSFLGKSVPGDDRAWIKYESSRGTGVYYAEAGRTYAKETMDGTTYYLTRETFPGETQPRYGADRYVELALESARFTAVGTTTHDGHRVIEFDAETVDSDDLAVPGENVSRRTDGELLVAESGLVHRVSVSERIETGDGEMFVFRIDVTLTDVGTTTIDRPDWYERAAEG